MAGGYGTVVLSGRTLIVTRLELKDGLLWIHAKATMARDWPADPDATAALFDPAGHAVCRGWRVAVPAVEAGLNLIIPFSLRLWIADAESPPVPGDVVPGELAPPFEVPFRAAPQIAPGALPGPDGG